jgi:hypothetical protein
MTALLPTRFPHTRLASRALALLCSLLTLAACDPTPFQLLEAPPPLAGRCAAEDADSDEDGDDMLRTRTPAEDRAAERGPARLPRALAPTGPPPIPPLSFPHTLLSADRPGAEHAFRNGVGTPLLC